MRALSSWAPRHSAAQKTKTKKHPAGFMVSICIPFYFSVRIIGYYRKVFKKRKQGKHSFMKKENFAGMKVLIMGLGLNGGGIEAAKYLANHGAELTVTDLKDEKELAPSIEQLSSFPVRYVLGRHEMDEFLNADMVIKNPGIKPDLPYLKAARRIETDISIFLAARPARILAVTGSKGKSSTSSALHWTLNEFYSQPGGPNGKAWLGGNITLSPLNFLDELNEKDTVVLELSSWQLGDLRGRDLLKPRAAVLTAIMRDHQNWYGSMEAYVADKRLIYKNQDEGDATIAGDDDWGKSFLSESKGRPLVYSSKPLNEGVSGGWVSGPDGPGLVRLPESRAMEVVPARLLVPGSHQKQNLLAAALALLDLGLEPGFVRESLGRFPGIEHRLEFFHESKGIRFYNDSAATIPEAAFAAVSALEKPETRLVLVSGGTDKNLDFSPLARAVANVKAIILLAGTGTDKLKILLNKDSIKYRGPFDSLDAAIKAALEEAASGDTVVLSPGCTSFGMFLNEFDRGLKWKEGVKKLTP
jgi:UDP-N-acetylmuramoylalanine--D-glutamate ligase